VTFYPARDHRFLALVVVLLALALSMTACGSHKGSASNVGVRFTDSLASGGRFTGHCIEPGDHVTTSNQVYWLPGPQNIRQDDWDTTNPDADHADITAYTSDGVKTYVRVNVNFGMVNSCDQLAKYLETIGITRGSWFNNDKDYTDGWITAMNYYISGNVEQRVKDQISKYKASELWPSQSKWSTITSNVLGSGDNSLVDAVKSSTNGQEYYTISAVKINNIEPDSSYKSNISERQAAATKAQTAKDNKQAQIAQAQADAAVAKANAAVQRAQISAFPSVDAWLKYQVILKGGNPFQPNGTLISPGQ
jgi:hypothetical protein